MRGDSFKYLHDCTERISNTVRSRDNDTTRDVIVYLQAFADLISWGAFTQKNGYSLLTRYEAISTETHVRFHYFSRGRWNSSCG